MPAVRKPTSVLVASGAFKKDPARARVNEPDTGRGIGPAPDWAPEEVRAEWDEIVSDCAPGVFQSSDRGALLAFAALKAELKQDVYGLSARKHALLLTYFSRFGMTASDRSRVSVPPPKQDGKPKTGLASFR